MSIDRANADLIESQYRIWLESPESVSPEWQAFFTGFELASQSSATTAEAPAPVPGDVAKQSAVQSLIYRYRDIGHLLACIDPLNPCPISHPLLDLAAFGLNETDLDTRFHAHTLPLQNPTLHEIISFLKAVYCGHIGVEFMHTQSPEERRWMQRRMEEEEEKKSISPDEQLAILKRLSEAALFEGFLHRKFLGQKRFSLEGGETLIAALEEMVEHAAKQGISDMIFGMAHRGRLNVLANIFRKPLANIFAEFADNIEYSYVGEGDVKYHKGFSVDRKTPYGSIHLSMASNPSHLEAVNPVVIGKSRARQDALGAGSEQWVVPVLIHGDAAFSGQGINAETLNLSGLDGYRTGGSIHIIINNQIGFTTAPRDSRSTHYATDMAKMLSVPIFHVNGDEPEAAVAAMRMALDYRMCFHRDAIIEIICYRRHGHNEGDEPFFTQPLMYEKIRAKEPVHTLYANRLLAEGIPPETIEPVTAGITAALETALQAPGDPHIDKGYLAKWAELSRSANRPPLPTAVPADRLIELGERLHQLPEGFTPHPKVQKLLDKRLEDLKEGKAIDWGGSEALAFATLLDEGHTVRVSGQDSRRGTFNHRHAVLTDLRSGERFTPLTTVGKGERSFSVYDSMLSEAAVLGFEYGYSLETPWGLTIWEAQFGDFANGAQVIIDQFISSSESKWGRASGLTMFLPHGFEGQGAEHSSARVERYLQLCAGDNLQVVYPSTPAQLFHMLRRQITRNFRRPLIVMTPKSLLRHPVCVSPISDFSEGSFQPVIIDRPDTKKIGRLVLCTGKVYYDARQHLEEKGLTGATLVRIEELHPLPAEPLGELATQLRKDAAIAWLQEEPANAGAWNHLRHHLREIFDREPAYLGRPASAAAAVGSHRAHKKEQDELMGALAAFVAQEKI